MKRVIMALVTTILATAPGCYAAEGRFERTLSVCGPVEMVVRAGAGHIHVRPGADSTVQVLGNLKVQEGFFSGSDVEKRVRYLESHPPIEQHGNIIKVGHITDPELQRNIAISYDLVVPVQTRLSSATGSGEQSCEGIAGPLDASSGSGAITASRIGGDLRASTGSGAIELDSIGGSVRATAGSGAIHARGVAGTFRAFTGSGPIALEQNTPGDVDVSTGSGRIDLKGVCGAVRASAATGAINVEGEGGEGAWNVETASGNIALHVPAPAGFELHARTVSGNIKSDQPLMVQGTVSRQELSGRSGSGGFRLDLATVSGDIRIE